MEDIPALKEFVMFKRDEVEHAILEGKTTIQISKGRPLDQIILGPPLRNYFIKIKTAFRKAIVFFAKRYPEPTRENCTGNWTMPFFDAMDKLVEYAKYREDLFVAVRKVVVDQIEHDDLYRDPAIAILEWLIQDILDGKLLPREEMRPDRQYWNEPPPYGGKYSIIYKLRVHRKEIKDLLNKPGEEEC